MADFFGLDHMFMVLQDVRGNTNIKMERNMLQEHEKTRRVFIRSLSDEEHMDLVERVVAECRQDDTEYEWSYSDEESEWSLNTSHM